MRLLVVPRKYPYYPAYDGKKSLPGTIKFAQLCKTRWGFDNWGIYNNRLMRNAKTVGKKLGDPGMEKYLSVHATGAAVDLAYPKTRAGRKAAKQAWDWFMEHSEALGICEVHDYAYRNPKQPATDKTAWGRGYRCSRGEGEKGVKIFDSKDNAGTPGGNWLHVELEPELAKSAEALTAAWKALPRPPKPE